jgi:hypothetical protein
MKLIQPGLFRKAMKHIVKLEADQTNVLATDQTNVLVKRWRRGSNAY